MYVNTWLAGDDATPGNFPSGGPEPWVVDVWKAAGSAIDFYSPDLYDPNFTEWCQRYHRDGNPLFMPETRGGAPGAANVFYALGEEAGFGFSPFAIESEIDPKGDLAASYSLLGRLSPLIAAAPGRWHRARFRPRPEPSLRRLHHERLHPPRHPR